MKSLTALLCAESIKLRRSLILGLALIFPLGLLVVSILVGALVIRPGEGATWRQWMSFSLVPWAYFLLPMMVEVQHWEFVPHEAIVDPGEATVSEGDPAAAP